MTIQLSEPRSDPGGLDDLRALWLQLHRHHREVADYRDLVGDEAASWRRRRDWYRRLLAGGAAYITATESGRLVGYAMVTVTPGPDDTFASESGIAEVLTLVVATGRRGAGVGAMLLRAAEAHARDRGADTMRIAVMSGNARAGDFYAANGYAVAEQVLYRRL
jgi:ribosomal protein S18 acetylase RimI-like enzyme